MYRRADVRRASVGPAERIAPLTAEFSTTRLIAILAVAGFASTFAGRSIEPLVGVLARDLHSDPHTVALLSTAFALPYAFIQPILGPVGDALGKERIIAICLGLLALALAGCAFTGDIATLFGLRVLAGGSAGGVVPLALALMGDRIPLERRQVAIGRFLVAVILGQLSGSTFAGLIEARIGWHGVFGITAGVAAFGCAAAAFGFQHNAGPPPRRPEFRTAVARYRGIVANPRARILFGAVFVEAIVVFGIFPHLAPLIEARGEGGPREAGLALAGFAAGGLLYSAFVGLMLRLLGLSRMLVAGGVICAGALLAIGLAGRWEFDCAALVALGLGFYMLHNTFQVQVTEVAPTARASAVALHAFSFFCGQALGVAILGAALQTVGQFPSLALCAVVIAGLGLVTAHLLMGRGQRTAP